MLKHGEDFFQHFYYILFLIFALQYLFVWWDFNSKAKLHDLTKKCKRHSICMERCKATYPDEKLIFATCVRQDSSDSFCFYLSEEQKVLRPQPLKSTEFFRNRKPVEFFLPELKSMRMTCNKDFICVNKCKKMYPKVKLIFATCVNKGSSNGFCFCFSEGSEQILRERCESDLALTCSDLKTCHVRCGKIHLYNGSTKPHFYLTGKCAKNEFGPYCYCTKWDVWS